MKAVKGFFYYIKNVVRLYKVSATYSKAYVAFSVVKIIVDTCLLYSGLIFLKLIVDELTGNKQKELVFLYVVLMCATNLVLKLISSIYDGYNEKKIEEFKVRFLFEIQQKTIGLSYQQIENPANIDAREKAMEIFYPKQAAFMNIQNTINASRTLVTNIVQLIGIVVTLLLVNPLIFLSLIFTCILGSVLNAIAANKEFEVWDNSMVKIGRRLGYFQELATNFKYAKEMRINKLQNWVSDKMYATAIKIIKGITIAVLSFTFMGIISGTVFALQDGGIYYYFTLITRNGSLTIGDFTVFINAIIAFIGIALAISDNVILIQKSGKYIDTYFDYLDIKEEQSVAKLEERNETSEVKGAKVEFKGVWFRYPSHEDYVLKDINLTIENGSKLVIVGENGAGKTTLIKLLLRFYKPTKGVILLNGRDINKMDFKVYMKRMSAVFQDFKILNASLLENIVFANEYDEAGIMEILKEVGLYDSVKDMKHGIYTEMGKQFNDEGIELSGGQQQKLAIARALFKESDMVILDEPTAMLSPTAEYEIYENFNRLVHGKTAIYISHRMSCCRFADHIAVFDQGKIVQYGTHDELIRAQGVYKTMFELQSEFYQKTVCS